MTKGSRRRNDRRSVRRRGPRAGGPPAAVPPGINRSAMTAGEDLFLSISEVLQRVAQRHDPKELSASLVVQSLSLVISNVAMQAGITKEMILSGMGAYIDQAEQLVRMREQRSQSPEPEGHGRIIITG